ncbi:hypothetical protein S40288_09937 [Stachybotrys chartarum IBT 40288]|nr:hypothetical protein S40288_09937 [Stachybotrys chartarum IBT 40288]
MPGDHTTVQPSWRPLAQRLSGLITRRGSVKGKSGSEITSEKGSVPIYKQKTRILKEGAQDFKPLEVDLNALEAFDLPDAWLESESQNRSEGEQRQKCDLVASNTKTPIADFFASRSVLDVPSSSQGLPPAYPQCQSNHSAKRPSAVLKTAHVVYSQGLADTASFTDDTQSVTSVLDRGRPLEPRYMVAGQSTTKDSKRWSLPPLDSNIKIQEPTTATQAVELPDCMRSSVDHTKKPLDYGAGEHATSGLNAPSRSRPSENRNTAAKQRHSMYEGCGTPSSATSLMGKPATVIPRSYSAAPTDRIQSWQRNGSWTSGARAYAPPPEHSAALMHSSPPARRVSPMGGVTSNRLAWIRELEEKKSGKVNDDRHGIKNSSGSVADKLAMFESKKTASTPPLRLPPVSRSNSTSRSSATGVESVFSTSSNVATISSRTSIDTARSNHRSSSVMSYYDESFVKKMESVVGGIAPEKNDVKTAKELKEAGEESSDPVVHQEEPAKDKSETP